MIDRMAKEELYNLWPNDEEWLIGQIVSKALRQNWSISDEFARAQLYTTRQQMMAEEQRERRLAHAREVAEQADRQQLNTPPVTLDDLPVVDSVTVSLTPVAPVNPDEVITHSLDCYDDATANPYVGKIGQLHELKMWFKTTQGEKARQYQKLTGREVPAALIGAIDHMIAVLEETMDTVEQEAAASVAAA